VSARPSPLGDEGGDRAAAGIRSSHAAAGHARSRRVRRPGRSGRGLTPSEDEKAAHRAGFTSRTAKVSVERIDLDARSRRSRGARRPLRDRPLSRLYTIEADRRAEPVLGEESIPVSRFACATSTTLTALFRPRDSSSHRHGLVCTPGQDRTRHAVRRSALFRRPGGNGYASRGRSSPLVAERTEWQSVHFLRTRRLPA